MKRFLPCLALLVALTGCSRSNELHDAMEDMKEPFKTMREANDLATIQAQLMTFVKAVEIAKVQKVKAEDQVSFDEGMQKLTKLISLLEQAVAAGNLEEAKSLLAQMGKVRKDYHEILGVK
ncbi:hypothetical protein DWB84_13650 [Saccharophagus sp. K07]|jgi:soluble cytochrome b562|uniref:cytochrome b562 n=1 Tax=Saccharophagus sp. K07 TaxID=2283636 RepID=UPI001651C53A|nr:cytochrome b562 [Saccharophagus sp. K07]MBC6906501.1 hypothetical protein [Saccharophagus sp. K07]